MAYTGICTLKGDKLDVFYKYVSSLYGRPVYTHEMLMLEKEIKELSRDDFMQLCAGDDGTYEDRLQQKMTELVYLLSEKHMTAAMVKFKDGIKVECKIDLTEWKDRPRRRGRNG